MNSLDRDPVIIVGAGPVGMVLAIELARRRGACRLIERTLQPSETSRSFTLHAKTMEMFEHMGIAHRFLEDGIKSKGFVFNFDGQKERPELDFTTIRSRYPYILVYNQNDTEQQLRDHLEATYGIRPEWGTSLSELTIDEDGDITAKLVRDGDNTEETAHPQWIVGCDGIHSFVRKASGLEFEGENYEGMIMQMMDVHCRQFEGDDDWVHYFMSKDNFLLVTKLPSGNHRVLISDMGVADDPELSQREAFQNVLDGHMRGTQLDEPEWATKWTIWKRLATGYRKGRTLLAGDAAHVHSPSGGQGMNIGMQDAFNLGWKLAAVIRGEAKSELLDTYEPERRPVGEQAILGTDAMHDIIMAHGHGMKDRLALTQAPGWNENVVNRISGLSYTYRDSLGVSGTSTLLDGPQAGDRAPDAKLTRNRRLFDLLRHPRHSLLLIPSGDKDGTTCRELIDAIETRFAAVVKTFVIGKSNLSDLASSNCVVDEFGEFGEVYGGYDTGHLYLVRPDGYVAFDGPLRDSEPLLAHLARWFGGD